MGKILGLKTGSFTATKTLSQNAGLQTPDVSFKRTYYVVSDTLDQDPQDVLATAGLPTQFDLVLGCRCRSADIKEAEVLIRHPVTGVRCVLYEIEYGFDNKVDPSQGNGGGGGGGHNPTQNRPKVRWYAVEEEEELKVDAVTGAPVQNAVGEKLLRTVPVPFPILEIKRYEFFPFDPNFIIVYGNKVNKEPFWGAPRGTALMLPPFTEEYIIGDVDDETGAAEYELVTYTIKFNLKRDATMEMLSAFTLIEPTYLLACQANGNSATFDPTRVAQTTGTVPMVLNPFLDTTNRAYYNAQVAAGNTRFDYPSPRYRSDTWQDEILHEGYKFKIATGDQSDPAFRKLYPNKLNPASIDATPPGNVGEIVLSVDETGNPVKVNLKLNGERFRPTETFQGPLLLTFNRFGYKDLNELFLGPFNGWSAP